VVGLQIENCKLKNVKMGGEAFQFPEAGQAIQERIQRSLAANL